jgi:hypothetical protein
MELTTYEKIMLWIMAIIEKIKEYFIRFYPSLAFVFSLIFAYAIARNYDLHNSINWAKVFLTAWIFTMITLLWVILSRKEK